MIDVALRGVAVAARNLFRSAALNLDFTSGNQTLDPRVTFSRASNATVTGPDGTLQYAPHNLLTFSEQFDNAAWSKSNATVTANAVAAPDGSMTADTLIATTTSGEHTLDQSFSVVSGTTYTFTAYVKAAGLTDIGLRFTVAALWTGSTSPQVRFNLTNGVASTITGSPASSSITNIGGGYYRVQMSVVAIGTGTASARLQLMSGSNNVFVGDGTSGIYIWGAQLNVGSLQPYYPTTVKNLLGFTQEFDNAAWTKSNSFVQTNLLTWSEQFDNAVWLKANATVTANAATAPDGTATADTITDSLDASAAVHAVQVPAAFASGVVYTASVHVKAGTLPGAAILFPSAAFAGNIQARFNVATGVVESVDTGVTASIVPLPNGWYRCVATATATASATTNIQLRLATATTTFYQGTGAGTAYLWGAQLVQGSTPGDYQRTEGTARAVMYPAPDGSRTADKLVEDAASAIHYTRPAASVSVVSGTLLTTSVYAKAGERSKLGLFPYNSAAGARFDLTNGTVISQESGVTASITPVGGGWFRCAASIAAPAGSATPWITVVNPSNATNYTGDGTSGIYIWGAQLSDSASLDPYVYNPGAAPTAAAYYGPRFDYDPVTRAPKGLLIEEQRTNSIRNNTMQGAVAGTPGTLPTNWNFTGGGIAVNVIGTGVEAGINYIDVQFVGTAASGSSGLRFEPTNFIAASSGQSWAGSLFVRRAAGSIANLSAIGVNVFGRTSANAGNTDTSTTQIMSELEAASIASNRKQHARTLTDATTAFVSVQLLFSHAVGAPIDITLRIGMPQLELGAFATSVIPTSGAAATRAADVAVMTGANFSNWYRQDEGTLFAEAEGALSTSTFFVVGVTDGSTEVAFIRNFSNTARFAAQGIASASAGAISPGQFYKAAFAFTSGDQGMSVNGGNALIGTTTITTAPTLMRIGQNSSGTSTITTHYKRIAYFPRRLSNAELQGITQ